MDGRGAETNMVVIVLGKQKWGDGGERSEKRKESSEERREERREERGERKSQVHHQSPTNYHN